MTRAEFTERSKEILAAKELTRIEKREMIRKAAEHHIEKIWDGILEVRDLRKRMVAAEKENAGYNGFSYCPESGTWYPKPPPAIKVLEWEWEGLRREKVNEVYWKAVKKLTEEAEREMYAKAYAKTDAKKNAEATA